MEKKRLQFDFTPEALAELDQLRALTGLPTRTELIRHALRFLQWALDETQNKKATLLLEKNGNIREVIFPFWTKVHQPTSVSEGGPDGDSDQPRQAALAAGSMSHHF